MINEEYTVFIDDVDIRSFGFIFQPSHSNPVVSGTRDYGVTIAGMNGAVDYGADLDPIPFDIPLYIPTTNPFDLQSMVRKLKDLIYDGFGKPRTFQLKFGYEPDKYYNVRVQGSIPADRILARRGALNLALICHEGYAISVAKNDEVTWGSEEITFTAEYTLGHNGSGAKTFTAPGSTIVTLSGHNQRPVIHITGSGTNVTVGWAGKTFGLGSFANATWLIDLDEYVVLRNGLLDLDALSGDWLLMTLLKGDNLIEINGSGLDLSFRVEFRDRYY